MTDETETAQAEARPENADEMAALMSEAAEAEPGIGDDGQPAPEADAPAEPQVSSAQALEMLLNPAFSIMAPRWSVQQSEVAALAKAWGDVADKYMPEGVTIGVELNAAIITLAILAPRMGTPRSDAAAEKAAAKREKKRAAAKGREAGEAAARAAEKADADDSGDDTPPSFDASAFSDDASNTPTRDTDHAT